MENALALAILTALFLGGLIASRYACLGAKDSLIVAAAIAVEVIALGVLVLVLTTQLVFQVPWLKVDLIPVLKGAIAILTTVAILGVCLLFATRLDKAGNRVGGSILFGAVTALLIGISLIGIRADQQSDDGLLRSLNPFVERPTETPLPVAAPTPTPIPGPTDIITRLARQPSLGKCSTSAVTVAWNTDVLANSTVKYGPTPRMEFQESDSTTRLQHAMTLTGLEANTTYYYQVISNRQAMAAPKTFTTSDSPDDSEFNFVVFGDSGVGSLAQFAIAALINDARPDFALHTGDVLYSIASRNSLNARQKLEGYEFNHMRLNEELWGPFYFLPYQDVMSSTCLYTSVGNHDRQLDSVESPFSYEDVLHLPNNNPAESELYYSFNYGRAHVIALESNGFSAGSIGFPDTPQFRWLGEDLQQASQDPNVDWIFVFFHHPPYASGGVNIDPRTRGRIMADVYVPVFEKFGVDVVFAGHDHTYERTCPIIKASCAGSDQDGILYIVTGGGGHPSLAPNECGADCPWSDFRAAAHHFVKVSVRGDSLVGEAIGLDGNVIDAFSVQKRR